MVVAWKAWPNVGGKVWIRFVQPSGMLGGPEEVPIRCAEMPYVSINDSGQIALACDSESSDTNRRLTVIRGRLG
jgi:hypothetical protein